MDKTIGDVPIFVAETMAIREVVMSATRLGLENIIMKCDSHVATKAPSLISNLILGTTSLVKDIRNIGCTYRNKLDKRMSWQKGPLYYGMLYFS